MKATDWSTWRRAYISGDDSVTLEFLSRQIDAPTEEAINKRCTREGWVQARAGFRREVSAKMLEVQKDVQHEVRKRQAELGQILQTLAKDGVSHIKLESLSARDIAYLAKVGAELERKALGIDEMTLRVVRSADDLKRMSDAELLEFAKSLEIENSIELN